MSQSIKTKGKLSSFFELLVQAIKGHEVDLTAISIKRAIILLAIPMMLEMAMESVFALVDLYFVGHLENSSNAIQTVGLTESVLTIIYSLAIGLSMAATAVVARRIGEKNPEAASKAGMQTILIAVSVNLIISILGLIYARDILLLMGASTVTADHGTPFVRIMMGGSLIIVLLFLINGIFRGAGNAAIAMRSLWIANIANIILCPIFINGFGPIPAFGLTGAAIATTIGRGLGVTYQVYNLFNGKNALKIIISNFIPDWEQIKAIVKIAVPGILQFSIGSCSYIFLTRLVATTGGPDGSAGFQTALRLMMFSILPAWGLSNASAALVGQNLGAGHLDRAEKSVFITMKYMVGFMAIISILSLTCGNLFAAFFTSDKKVIEIASYALKTLSIGFIIYGLGMVLTSAFNGAGDTWTPTKINVFAFWLFQIPFAYFLTRFLELGPTGVFIAIPTAEAGIAVAAYILFKKGKWKKTVV
ncbi:MATE family efflux transporter [Pedobacter sp. HDW13]|uniref:MATE family efflux transporter n=1 Tax=unclassified Pedobacter TaxID=2628915 RepID=UPI000F597823|nr:MULTISPECIES: MATE family efflux transporter [unclassified Pedobacter]QIL42014.1 MATE family efflux transporter [Pedobacter sp. HDW13]RQO64644.1 MATE family efflux transporter [Pedobacter sp. KBW01]